MMVAACSNSKEESKNTVATTDTTSFYPVASYIKDQVKYFDSLGVRFSVAKDSVTVQIADIMPMIQSFIEADISDSIQKVNYKESVFRDAGTASLNINYTPLNTSVPIRNIDILMDDQTSVIKRLFIRKQFQSKDTTSTEQLSWKTNEGFIKSISQVASNGFLRNKTITVRVILP
jgi:hypothetical protein